MRRRVSREVHTLGPYFAAVSVALSFVLLILAGMYTFRQQEHVNRQLCKQTVENRGATRQTWNAARDLILQAQTEPDRRSATNEFFNGILAQIPPLVCVNNKPVAVD
jgi:hypothetical protein